MVREFIVPLLGSIALVAMCGYALVAIGARIRSLFRSLGRNPADLIRKSTSSRDGVHFLARSFHLKHNVKTEVIARCGQTETWQNTYHWVPFSVDVPIQSAPPSKVHVYCPGCGGPVCVTAHSYVRYRRFLVILVACPIVFALLGAVLFMSLLSVVGIVFGALAGFFVAAALGRRVWGTGVFQIEAQGEKHIVSSAD